MQKNTYIPVNVRYLSFGVLVYDSDGYLKGRVGYRKKVIGALCAGQLRQGGTCWIAWHLTFVEPGPVRKDFKFGKLNLFGFKGRSRFFQFSLNMAQIFLKNTLAFRF